MREVNDQYPEYAEPYEPIKGGKHHKGIYGTRGPDRRNTPQRFLFFAFIGFLILLLTISRPGTEEPGAEPQASTKETTVTTETTPDEPETPETPEPPINPEEHKDIPEEPEEKPEEEPETPATPATPASPVSEEPEEEPEEESEEEPEEEPTTPVSPTTPDDPATPDDPVTPTYKDPTASISHVYYWYCLDHIEVEYEITANDGENITSSSTVTSNADSSMTVTMPTKSGDGTIDANADSTGKLSYTSADVWTTDLTLNYTLNGEDKTLTVSNTAEPEFKGFLWLSPQYLSGNSSTTNKIVSDAIYFRYPKDDRHTYDMSITKIEMGWMKKVPISGGGSTFEKVGSTIKTVWDGTGTSPITGPTGPTVNGDNKELKFSYADILDVTPPADAAGATHFYLNYYMKGTGTDKDGTVYTIKTPDYAQSTPCEIAEEPTVTIDHVYDWDNLHHVEVEYTIEPNSATILSSTGTVTSVADPSQSITLPYQYTEGTIDANVDANGYLHYASGDEWKTEITLQYILAGETKTLTVTDTGQPEFPAFLRLNAPEPTVSGTNDNLTFSSKLDFVYPASDRHTYDPSDLLVTKIELGWMKKDSSDIYVPVGSTRTVYPGTGTVTAPTGPTTDGDDKILQFTYEGTMDATPPDDAAGAAAIYFIYEITGTGTDSTDGRVYSIAWPRTKKSEEAELPGTTPVTYTEPTVSLSYDDVYWYSTVDHVTAEYDITANDATDITSQATITYEYAGSMSFALPEASGAGTVSVEANAGGNVTIFSGGNWVTTVKLKYKLGGEDKEKDFQFEGRPQVRYVDFDSVLGSKSGTLEEMDIGYEVNLTSKTDDPHTYSIDFSKVEIEWFTIDTYGNETSVGTKSIWNKGDTKQVFWGPYVSTPDPNDPSQNIITYSFWYADLDATPPNPSATKFRLIFYADVNGDDSYDTKDDAFTFTELESLPASGSATYTEPTVTIGSVTWWKGLDHVEVGYDLTENDAEDINVTAKVTSSGGSYTEAPDSVSGSGGKTFDFNPGGSLDHSAGEQWEVTIVLSYKLGGVDKTSDFTDQLDPTVYSYETGVVVGDHPPSGTIDNMTAGYLVYLIYNKDDIHNYELSLDSVEFEWLDGSGGALASSTITDCCKLFTPGVTRGPSDSNYRYECSFECTGLDATPPSGAESATQFRLYIDVNVEGDDWYDTTKTYILTTDVLDLPSSGSTVTKPDVTVDSVTWRRSTDTLEMQYMIDPGDAEAVYSSTSVIADTEFNKSCTMSEGNGSGTITVTADAADYHDMLLGGVVNITIHVNYRIGGEDKEEYYTFYDVDTTTINNN